MWDSTPERTFIRDQRLAEARKLLGDIDKHMRLHGAGVPDEVVFEGLLAEFINTVPGQMVVVIAAAAVLDRVRPPVVLPEV